MNPDWLTTTGESVLMVLISTLGIYLALVLFTRIAGLRSFSKMSSVDFAVTVAVGSLLASTILMSDPPLIRSLVALAALFLLQYLFSLMRMRSERLKGVVDNMPILVMAGPEILYENLRRTRMTEDDLFSKLRKANVCRLEQVRAVIVETTGDVSVLHDDPDGPPLDVEILRGVRGSERLGGGG